MCPTPDCVAGLISFLIGGYAMWSWPGQTLPGGLISSVVCSSVIRDCASVLLLFDANVRLNKRRSWD